MAANKSKKQFQGKNRRFRGDVWLDEKVSGRTMHALQTRGVKFPAKLKLFRQEHAAKIAAKKEAAQKAAQQPAAEEAAQ